jgi:transposase/DDE superfamily endonuclease
MNVPTPKTPTKTTTRDDRLRIQTLYYTAGWTVSDLLLQLPFTRRQIDYALTSRPTPQKIKCGRHVLLDTPTRKLLVNWATASSRSRDIPWAELPKELGWDCSSSAIRTAFKKEGYVRGIRRKCPPLSAKNQQARLDWAIEHENWTIDQWNTVLWSDETWVSPGYHRRQFCTRLKGSSELYNPDCITHRWQRKIGWMFWGCISGKYGKGPGLFWEKNWGSITADSYQEHTFPIVWNYIYIASHLGLVFQQDGGPGHNAKATLNWIAARGVTPIFWPAFSPDLSPIETLWCRMKDILQELDPEVHRNYLRLRKAVQEAWELITDAEIHDILFNEESGMQARCKAVIAAGGLYTKF